ncbi:glutaredoxin family protein [Roseovarius rhodophyticola]|uniref:Glutaredoxin n=1 Tax=Roseovarius rhodophyticola TaxID=3080827 RepID=A0ABZ2TEG2_9RHOB|nr:glutaredoxin [Roseovarius sp. W115]MDV2928345.1 glutaredoxin [Roseovarius sp. W115]
MPKATLYRMDLPNYTCGYGTAARDLLRSNGFDIEEHILRTRAATDKFKDKHHITTTPLVFIDGVKIGGYTDLKKHLKAQKPKKKRFWQR